MSRKFYLDNLKIFLTLLVIFHHAGQAYGNGGAWIYMPSNHDEFMPWIWHFFSVNACFFMGLFFFISGHFAPKSYDKQGFAVFVKKKLLRLGLPLVVVGGVISLLCGKFEIAHLWYVESLLLFCLVYALLRRKFKPLEESDGPQLTIWLLGAIATAMGIGGCLIRSVSPQDHWIWPLGIIPLPMEPAHYLQYVMMFVLGLLSSRFLWLEKMSNRVGGTSLAIGLAFALGEYLRGDNSWGALVWQYFGLYESMLCIFVSFGLMWLFRQRMNVTSKFLEWCSAQSFGAYVVHLPLMIVIQNMFDKVWMGALGKFLFIGVATTVVSYLVAWMLRCIPGVKRCL